MLLHLKTFISGCHISHQCCMNIPQSRKAFHLFVMERKFCSTFIQRKQHSLSSFSIHFKSNTNQIEDNSNFKNLLHKNKFITKTNEFSNIQPVRCFQSKQNIERVHSNEEDTFTEENKHSNNEDKKISLILYGAFTALFSFGIFYTMKKLNVMEVYTDHCNQFLKKMRIEGTTLLKPIACVQLTIIGLNVLIWFMWKIPVLHPTLSKTFLNGSSSQSVLSLIGSAFSHVSFIHLALNMYVLQTFIEAWHHYATYHRNLLPQNYMSADRFLSFYLSAAAISSFGSLAVKKLGGVATPSLGASGAILAVVGYICSKSPDSRLGIILIPNWSFTSENGLKAILAFDTLGLIFNAITKWKFSFIDHAAHLSGVLYGMWYARYGEKLVHELLNKGQKKK